MSQQNVQVPSEFLCSLTGKIMHDPMVTREGINYEKSAILKWLNEGNNTCPVTGNPVRLSCLISNRALEKKIRLFQGEEFEDHGDVPDMDALALQACFAVAPDRFLCPLTKKIMEHPMVTRNEINFERDAILAWLEENDNCPVTGNPLCPSKVIPNNRLQREINEWQTANGDSIYAMALEFHDKKVAHIKEPSSSVHHHHHHSTHIITKVRNVLSKHTPQKGKHANARSA